MGHSIRSKKKRAFRALKRERYELKERACLEKIIEEGTIKKYLEEYANSKEEPMEGVNKSQPSVPSEVSSSIQEIKDDSDSQTTKKRNWDSKNQIRKKRKKETLLKMKNKRKGKAYKFKSGTMSKSSW